MSEVVAPAAEALAPREAPDGFAGATERGDSVLPAAEEGSSSPSSPPAPLSAADRAAHARTFIGNPINKPWQPKELNGRHKVMLEYHLAGWTYRDIAKKLECGEVDVGLVIRSDLAQEYIAARLNDLNQEFQGLFRKVIDVIDLSLQHPDLEIAQKAADKWLRAHGRYAPKKDEAAALTAEDVIAKLLNKAGNVTVNVDARRQYSYRSEANAGS